MAPDAPPPVGPAVTGWNARLRPTHQPMAGRYCRLEPLDPSAHAPALFDAFRLDAAGVGWTYLPYGPFDRFDAFRAWTERISAPDDPLFFAVLDEGATPVGLASYLRVTPEHGVIEVGHIHYSVLLQRRRAATETMYLMMRRVFDELGYRRYEWKCDALNAPSRKAADRLGFVYEGTFRKHVIYKGRSRDTAWYSVIDDEWPALKRAFEAWLDPANFDALGEQKRSLRELR